MPALKQNTEIPFPSHYRDDYITNCFPLPRIKVCDSGQTDELVWAAGLFPKPNSGISLKPEQFSSPGTAGGALGADGSGGEV